MEEQITIEDVKNAYDRIKTHIKKTPLEYSFNLTKITNANIYLKLENFQRCRAFKYRGALSKISTLPKGSSIVCVSAGNHSQGCALSSSLFGIKCVVYMPETAPQSKVDATRKYGAEVRQYGNSFDEANEKCKEDLKKEPSLIFVPPFDDKEVIAGQGTISLEIAEQLPNVNTVIVSVGGGGLCAGIALTIKSLIPNCRVIAVNAAKTPATYLKYQKAKGRPIDPITETEPLKTGNPIADGIAVKVPGTMTFPYIEKYVDEFVVVTEHEIACAISLLAERVKVVTEGAGASTLAAVLFKKFKFEENENIVCVLSGGNIPLSRLSECFIEAKDYLLHQ